jgi:hypothetical protein
MNDSSRHPSFPICVGFCSLPPSLLPSALPFQAGKNHRQTNEEEHCTRARAAWILFFLALRTALTHRQYQPILASCRRHLYALTSEPHARQIKKPNQTQLLSFASCKSTNWSQLRLLYSSSIAVVYRIAYASAQPTDILYPPSDLVYQFRICKQNTKRSRVSVGRIIKMCLGAINRVYLMR